MKISGTYISVTSPFRRDILGKGSVCGAHTKEISMLSLDGNTKPIETLHFRLSQARKIAGTAEICALEECPERTIRLLEGVEGLIRDACHLVIAGHG